MRRTDIEHLVLSINDRVLAGQSIEDSLVEMKAEWPDHARAARRIAGHINAAGGEPVVWLIGMDAIRGAVGAADETLASWWSQVQSHFEGLIPDMDDVVVHVGANSVHALVFESTAAPLVVKNPSGRGPDREVPYRDGTGVRSAKRQDLLRILVPAQKLPTIDVLSATLLAHPHPEAATRIGRWQVNAELYVVGPHGTETVLPFHRSNIRIVTSRHERSQQLRFSHAAGARIILSNAELIAAPAGVAMVDLSWDEPAGVEAPPGEAVVRIELGVAGIDRVATVDVQMTRTSHDGALVAAWARAEPPESWRSLASTLRPSVTAPRGAGLSEVFLLFQVIDDEEARRRRAAIWRGISGKRPVDLDETEWEIVERTATDFDMVGIAVTRELVEPSLIFERYAEVIVPLWEAIEAHVRYRREAKGGWAWNAFERMAFAAREWSVANRGTDVFRRFSTSNNGPTS